jgi:uncharacterized protein YprB with RNaseH-like and TPR domain
MDAYLDIETTGLSPCMDAITVVGICRDTPEGPELRQLVGSDISRDSVEAALAGVTTLYTYNGIRFDAVFLESHWTTRCHRPYPQRPHVRLLAPTALRRPQDC